MDNLNERTIKAIGQAADREVSECQCDTCKSYCKTPCLPTPVDVASIFLAGYGNRMAKTEWLAGMLTLKVTNKPITLVAPRYDPEKKACTFFTNGLCELHESGLKPTEGKLTTHHPTDSPEKSLAWLVAQTWII